MLRWLYSKYRTWKELDIIRGTPSAEQFMQNSLRGKAEIVWTCTEDGNWIRKKYIEKVNMEKVCVTKENIIRR